MSKLRRHNGTQSDTTSVHLPRRFVDLLRVVSAMRKESMITTINVNFLEVLERMEQEDIAARIRPGNPIPHPTNDVGKIEKDDKIKAPAKTVRKEKPKLVAATTPTRRVAEETTARTRSPSASKKKDTTHIGENSI